MPKAGGKEYFPAGLHIQVAVVTPQVFITN
jgi:hypothetical protein